MIMNYIQYLAIHANHAPDQYEYESKFGGKQNWFTDAAEMMRSKGIDVNQVKANILKVGVELGENKKQETAGMRRQYFLDCARVGKVIPLQAWC